ncbi:MAG: rhomboid family intramembrane serine protease [bacterium]|nr:rhomboid family intramembrane serine protease [bacterium]
MIPLRDSQPSLTTPIVTVGLIVVNVVVFLYQVSLDDYSLNHLIRTYGAIPSHWSLANLPAALVTESHRLISAAFLHGGWLHPLGNMWFLWIYGDNVEDILGKWKYLFFYLACGVLASLIHIGFNGDSQAPMIGASGAIAGVMGAYLVKFPHSRIKTLIWIFVFVTVIEIPAVLILVYWLLIQVVSSVYSIGSMSASSGGTAWFAHVGGFVVGVVLIKLMGTRERFRHNMDMHW